MTPDNLEKNTYQLERTLSREKSIRYVLLGSLALMTFAFISKTNDTKTILIPIGTENQSVFISNNEASQEYLKLTTEKILSLGFTYSPVTAQENFDNLLKLVDPSHYGTLNKITVKKLEEIKKNNVSSVFFPSEFNYELKQQKVAAKGVLKTYSGEKLVSNEAKTILFEYRVSDQNIRLVAYTDVTHLKTPFSAQAKDSK
ncbi:TraE/TraK family type IV conjugative transfer system protein [Thiomicrorhabdus aquaedulcis]|uniref:TraE/TraK family type IV conjugative transfer system protein n=1 Tax=Thiomicrorhabdus aquaedulcis TaxID=2211106 RepID=UPI000FDB2635|nr:TraE/TraK family type IV conjugative transfer system protein [Thiomicrorhabdus aquaedulcis]